MTTDEAEEFFKERTERHIAYYGRQVVNLLKNATFNENEKNILDKSIITHDKSKYSKEELEGYIILTWSFKNQRSIIDDEDIKKVKKAVKAHHGKNSHHPEFFDNLKRMLRVDIAQMVCDHAAIAEELNTSVSDYTKNYTVVKYPWSDYQKYLIWHYVEELTKGG